MARTLDTPLVARSQGTTDWPLRLVVFTGGAVSIGIELAASRLLAPFFGTSLFIWATLIGLVLIYLSVGYVIGGKLADRYPDANVLYGITAVAAFVTGLIPLISRPILAASITAFSAFSLGGFYGSLLGTVVLFAIPVTLLGCVSPYAIRLSVQSLAGAGNTAGSLYALSTVGSILGTFIPTFLLIPRIGTFRTFYLFAVVLLTVSAFGLITVPAPRRRRGLITVSLVLLCVMLFVASFGASGFVRPVDNTHALVYQGESAYNFIQVVHSTDSGANELLLNEGHAIHSIYYPEAAATNQPLTRGPWDYFVLAPYFTPGARTTSLHDVCFIGLAAGTGAGRMTQSFPNLQIDGVEIDPKIVEVGQKYFAMTEPNLHIIVEDGRYYLKATTKHYDVIAVDAYKQPYIPFQLTTKEFFTEARDHLNPNGTLIVNAGRSATDYRLVDVISQTMRAVYPHVFTIDTQNFTNTMVIGSTDPNASIADFTKNIEAESFVNPNSPVVAMGNTAIQSGKMQDRPPGPMVFTDDLAPVEDLVDRIILDYARKGE